MLCETLFIKKNPKNVYNGHKRLSSKEYQDFSRIFGIFLTTNNLC